MKVLLVEDDDDLRFLVRLTLETAGFYVVEAPTGESAVETVAKDYDAMLLDIRLPGIDGFEVMRRLPTPWPFPVVAMSAHASRHTARAALEMGCSDYLTKPFSNDQLIETLHRATAA